MKEDSNYEDNYHKYTKKLDTFYRLKEAINRNKTTLAVEISHMKTVKTDQNEQLNESYEKMVNREKEIGVGLILAKTGKEIPEKVCLLLRLESFSIILFLVRTAIVVESRSEDRGAFQFTFAVHQIKRQHDGKGNRFGSLR